jgi:3-oxoacyl-[acyl-carrier-protein] synthase-3
MALLKYSNVGIKAMAAAVPHTIINNLNYTQHFTSEEAKMIVEKTGINERRFADDKTCSSDLCYAAADRLIEENNIDRKEIDLMVFISQTPDYRMPATSFLIQERLKLPESTIVFDVNLGCSGFVHGLYIVYGLMQQSGLRKALLLNGETRSKVYSPKDRPVAFLFGDAGSAVLIEKDESFGESFFSINSNGANADMVMIPAGGYRKPTTVETLKEKVIDENGNIRSEEQAYMRGEDVFHWLLTKVPKDIKEVLSYSKTDKEIIDFFVLHQANNFMNSYLAKKLKIEKEKIPSTISKFGNTSSVSIPLTMVSELKNELVVPKKLLLSGFGVGMTWASAIINTNQCRISDIVEV